VSQVTVLSVRTVLLLSEALLIYLCCSPPGYLFYPFIELVINLVRMWVRIKVLLLLVCLVTLVLPLANLPVGLVLLVLLCSFLGGASLTYFLFQTTSFVSLPTGCKCGASPGGEYS
jgi:hypothetical protein